MRETGRDSSLGTNGHLDGTECKEKKRGVSQQRSKGQAIRRRPVSCHSSGRKRGFESSGGASITERCRWCSANNTLGQMNRYAW